MDIYKSMIQRPLGFQVFNPGKKKGTPKDALQICINTD
jgi:hypothetical protein